VSGRWRWQDLPLAGKSLACLVFFLAYLGPAHLSDAGESYPWYVRLGLLWPWWVQAIELLWPGPVRLPFNPGLCSLIAVLLGAFIFHVGKLAFQGTEPIPEWVAATAIAGLAAVMTGPMLRAYEAAEEERLARQGSPGVADRDRST